MALYDRLKGGEEPKLPIHSFVAGLAEVQRGVVTRAQFIAAFGITVAEEADLDALINKATSLPAARRHEFRTAMHDWLLLAETGHAYTTQAAFVNRVQAFT